MPTQQFIRQIICYFLLELRCAGQRNDRGLVVDGGAIGLVVSDLAFYARGWKEEKETGKICLTSLSMQLTVAKPDGTPVYTQTAVSLGT